LKQLESTTSCFQEIKIVPMKDLALEKIFYIKKFHPISEVALGTNFYYFYYNNILYFFLTFACGEELQALP
jgi:hypothetical protein